MPKVKVDATLGNLHYPVYLLHSYHMIMPGSLVEQCLAADNWMRTVVGTSHDALQL